MKKLYILLLLSECFLPAVSSPVRSNMGGEEVSRIEDDAPVNLWSWPTDLLFYSASPSTIWTPQLNVWYGRIAENGYSLVRSSPYGEFDNESVTTIFQTGYSLGVFLPIFSGHYILRCNVSGRSKFRLGFYRETTSGYLWTSSSLLGVKSSSGIYERVFTVPEGCSLMLLLPTSSDSSASPLTVTDIEIYRLD